ncbi:MAG: serine hydrolase [Faecalimonas sp.]
MANPAGRSLSAGRFYQSAEIRTGQILWEENKDVSWAPASMTKLMTILLAYDAMEEGKFEKDMQVAVNEKYTDIAGRYALSNNVMQMGATYTVGELIDLEVIVPASSCGSP